MAYSMDNARQELASLSGLALYQDYFRQRYYRACQKTGCAPIYTAPSACCVNILSNAGYALQAPRDAQKQLLAAILESLRQTVHGNGCLAGPVQLLHLCLVVQPSLSRGLPERAGLLSNHHTWMALGSPTNDTESIGVELLEHGMFWAQVGRNEILGAFYSLGRPHRQRTAVIAAARLRFGAFCSNIDEWNLMGRPFAPELAPDFLIRDRAFCAAVDPKKAASGFRRLDNDDMLDEDVQQAVMDGTNDAAEARRTTVIATLANA